MDKVIINITTVTPLRIDPLSWSITRVLMTGVDPEEITKNRMLATKLVMRLDSLSLQDAKNVVLAICQKQEEEETNEPT